MVFQLVVKRFDENELPSDKQEIINAGMVMSEDVPKNWKKGKLYKFKEKCLQKDGKAIAVQTYSRGSGSDYWMSRISKHKISKETYTDLVYYLNGSQRDSTTDGKWVMKDRTFRSKMEIEYIEVLSHYEILDLTKSGWVLVNLEYELGKPLHTREFNEWVYPIEPFTNSNGNEVSMVISLQANKPLKESTRHKNHTPAYYVSVEKLEYDYAKENLVWTMCTACDAGGNVPKWVQNATIAKTVANDVPFLFKYIAEKSETKQ